MTEKEDVSETTETKLTDDEEALEKLAVEELMREAVQGAARAELVGPSGWVNNPKQKTNKRFLANTIRHAVSSNKYHSSRKSRRSRSRSPRRDRHSDSARKENRRRNESHRRH